MIRISHQLGLGALAMLLTANGCKSARESEPESRRVVCGAAGFEDLDRTDGTNADGFCSADGWCWEHPLPQGNDLYDVLALTPNDVWAVGEGGTALHYDGRAWTPVGTTTTANLNSLWGHAADDVWAVGESATVLRFDGSSWRLVSVPADARFNGVWGSAADDVWIVGVRFDNEQQKAHDVVLHWNGSVWTDVPVSSSFLLSDIWGTASDDVWVVGPGDSFDDEPGGLLHWDGQRWTSTPVADKWAPERLWGTATNDVWAIGRGTLLHWDGRAWTQTVPEELEHRFFEDVWGIGSSDIRVLNYGDSLYRWNGSEWNLAFSSLDAAEDSSTEFQPGPDALSGTGPDDVWAVGRAGLITHWNGKRWTRFGAGWNIGFESMWVDNDGSDVWLVGEDAGLVGGLSPLIHFDGESWRRPSCNRAMSLTSIWGSSPSSVWAFNRCGTTFFWDGRGWSELDLAFEPCGDRISSAWGSGPEDVWAAGSAFRHWDGTRWTRQDLPLTKKPFNSVEDMWGSGPDNVWAVGGDIVASPFVLHWDGTMWADRSNEIDSNIGFGAVWTAAANDVWLGGQTRVGDQFYGVILHWDGTTWSEVARHAGAAIVDISGSARNGVWALASDGTVLRWTDQGFVRDRKNARIGFSLHPRIRVHGDAVWTASGYAIQRKRLR